MQQAKEDLLVLTAQTGNQQAFEALYQLYNMPLRRFAYRLCRDEHLAVDAVQEAWITLSKKIRTLEDPRRFRLWAYKTVRWRLLDQVRAKGQKDLPLEEETATVGPQVSEYATEDQLQHHLTSLPTVEKVVLTLFYLEEMSLAEIAVLERVPVGTVKSRLNRARERLKDSMTGEIS